MRRAALLVLAGFVLSACGDTPPPATQPRVKLELTAPDDGGSTFEDRIALRGTVTPADAAVRVAGEEAQVDGGEFTAEIPLNPGANVIDVTATAPGRRPATDAIRVERDVRILVPDVTGLELNAAIATLEANDLEATEERGGDWLDRLLGGPVNVCVMRPGAGDRVDPGTTVTLETARDCG